MGCPLGPRPGPRARALPGPGLMLQGSAARPAVASPALGDTGLEPCSDLAEFTGPDALAFRLPLDLGDATDRHPPPVPPEPARGGNRCTTCPERDRPTTISAANAPNTPRTTA